MRNIVEYPLTVDEVLEEIKEIYKEESESQEKNGFKFGDMRLLILSTLYSFVDRNKEKFSFSIKEEIIY